MRTNALSLDPGFSIGNIFPVVRRFNYECRSNIQHTWNSSRKHETIHAIRDIKAGEEITIFYNLGGPSQLRRARMETSSLITQVNFVLSRPTPFGRSTIAESGSKFLTMKLETLAVSWLVPDRAWKLHIYLYLHLMAASDISSVQSLVDNYSMLFNHIINVILLYIPPDIDILRYSLWSTQFACRHARLPIYRHSYN